MGWREALDDRPSEYALMELLPADRIALARELLAGTGRVVARDVGEIPNDEWGGVSRAAGWNACRAAMMGGATADDMPGIKAQILNRRAMMVLGCLNDDAT
jgi:hypothetical protein